MTAERLITEFENLAPAEQQKVFKYLFRRGTELVTSETDEEGVSDSEFEAALRKVMTNNYDLLRRLAQ